MCRNSRLPLLLLSLLWLLSALGLSWADESMSPDTSLNSQDFTTNTSPESSNLTQEPLSLNEAWEMLKAELLESSNDSAQQLIWLEELQIETVELKSSLELSTKLYEEEKEARINEREAARKVIGNLRYEAEVLERKLNIWRPTAIGFGVATIVAWGIVAITSLP